MDDYPIELIDGVTPLIFAVDAVLTKNDGDDDKGNGGGGNRMNNANHYGNQRSTAFDSFYNYISSQKQQYHNRQDHHHNQQHGHQQSPAFDPLSDILSADPALAVAAAIRTLPSFHRYARNNNNNNSNSNSNNKAKTDFFAHARMVPVSNRHAFPPSKDPHGNQNSIAKLNHALHATARKGYHLHKSTTNTAHNLAHTTPSSPITAILANDPIAGILPEGWIEKHTHALPSTILIVTRISLTASPYKQALLEQHLFNTIENITSTGAKKRDSPIHVVCLIEQHSQSGIATLKEAAIESERIGNIRTMCRLGSGGVSPLHYYHQIDDNNSNNNNNNSSSSHDRVGTGSGTGTTIFLQEDYQKLQKTIEGESMLYYLTQVRRCKRKHASLHHEKFVDLLPFAARYCIKIAVFYEFQSCVDQTRGEKSARYWAEAYRNIKDYYLFLLGRGGGGGGNNVSGSGSGKRAGNSEEGRLNSQLEMESLVPRTAGSEDSEKGGLDGGDGDDDGMSPPSPPPSSENHDGVEVALVYSPRRGNDKFSIDPDNNGGDDKRNGNFPDLVKEKELKQSAAGNGHDDDDDDGSNEELVTHSKDMIQQCRAVADIVNIKLMLTNYASAIRSLANGNKMADVDTTSNTEQSQAYPFASLAAQISTHSQVFLSTQFIKAGSNLFDPQWYFLAFVARQRLVISEFLQLYPISKDLAVTLNIETASVCNSFHQYMSCGEAFLRLSSSVKKVAGGQLSLGAGSGASDDKERFVGCLGNQDLVTAWEIESNKEHLGLALEYLTRAVDIFTLEMKGGEDQSDRLLARAYFLMAGIYTRQEEYDKAMRLLQLASPLVSQFPIIRNAIDAAMSTCLQNCNEELDSEAAAMQILNCSSNALISKTRLRYLSESIADSNMTKVKWPYASESSQALQYSFTFPSITSVTEGDTIQGALYINSRFPFPVKIESVDLSMNVGNVNVEVLDSVVFPGQTVILNAKVAIPNECMKDVDSKTLDRQSVKRPRKSTFGLTKIGGALFGRAIEEKLSGGFVVACMDAQFTLSLPEFDGNHVTVCFQNHHRGTFPVKSEIKMDDAKKISLEEDNFVYSAWSRPDCFPMSAGPRCLRVLRAQSLLEIIDLTSPSVGKKAMEGTVNRFMLQLKAGAMEKCLDLKMRVSCASWVDTVGNDEHETIDTLPSETTVPSRLPILVTPNPVSSSVDDFIDLAGWRELGNIQGGILDEWVAVADSVGDSGMVTFVDLYRPLSKNEEVIEYHCKTRFTVDIAYKQIRLDQERSEREHVSVVKTYQGTVTWCSPFEAKFDVLPRKEVSTPSGSRHPTNFVGADSLSLDKKAVISGSHVPVAFTLTSRGAANNLAVEVNRVTYQPIAEDEECKVSLVERTNTSLPQVLYAPKVNDFCNQLTNGSKLKIAYTVCPEVKYVEFDDSEYAQAASAPLGAVSIAWTPIPLPKPDHISESSPDDEFARKHGPLPIKDLPPYKRTGPIFYVEATPFDASFETVPSMPRVSVPFEVRYTVKNKTKTQQRVQISMTESADATNSMLVSGIINCDLLLGPDESKCLRYTLLVTKVGRIDLPALSISSLRFDTWIIKSGNQGSIYVLP